MICWVDGFGNTTLPTTPGGWSIAAQQAGTSNGSTTIFYKIAAGADASPTIAAATGTTWYAQLGEFVGNASVSPLDKVGSVNNNSPTSPVSLSTSAGDTTANELIVYSMCFVMGASVTLTNTTTLNNGATATDTNNGGVSTFQHYSFGYGVTTSNSIADKATATWTGANVSKLDIAAASFKIGGTLTSNYTAVGSRLGQAFMEFTNQSQPSGIGISLTATATNSVSDTYGGGVALFSVNNPGKQTMNIYNNFTGGIVATGEQVGGIRRMAIDVTDSVTGQVITNTGSAEGWGSGSYGNNSTPPLTYGS